MVIGILLQAVAMAYATPNLSYSITDVEKHNLVSDCWIIIEDKIYDVTKYLPDHDQYTKVLRESCGKDATEGWKTKGNKNKPHSKKAQLLLKRYEIGALKR